MMEHVLVQREDTSTQMNRDVYCAMSLVNLVIQEINARRAPLDLLLGQVSASHVLETSIYEVTSV
jgi:hypothetical protein